MSEIKKHTKLYPLSHSQIPEWYVYQLAPKSPVYNISFNHFFFKDINIDACVFAWLTIIDRHDVFRIHFTYHDGKPLQSLLPKLNLTEKDILIDRSDICKESVVAIQAQLAKEYADLPFDLNNGYPFRLKIVKYPQNEYQLIFTVHHIIWDETSTINLIKEFRECYNAFVEKKPIALPPIEKNYLDCVETAENLIGQGMYTQQKKYWEEIFSSEVSPLNLPCDFERPSIQTYNGDTHSIWLDRSLIHRASTYILNNNSTLYIFFITVIACYFARITQQSNFVIGTPIAGRNMPDTKNLLGCFAKAIPIRFDISIFMTFHDLITLTTERILQAFENSDYPCGSIIENLSHQKDLSRPKLFSVMSGVQNNKSDFIDIQLAQGTFFSKEIYSSETHGARFDLAIGLDPIGSDIKFFCTYNTDIFLKGTIVDMMDSIATLMNAIIENDNLSLCNYPIMSAHQLNYLLENYSYTKLPSIVPKTVSDLFYEQANLSPNYVAIIDDQYSVTYGALQTCVTLFCINLLKAGFNFEHRIAVILLPNITSIVTLLALIKIGACYIPIDPYSTDQHILNIVLSSKANAIIVSDEHVPLADHVIPAYKTSQFAECSTQIPIEGSANFLSLKHLAYILYTSGTTGNPKGIPIMHTGITNLIFALQEKYLLSSSDKILHLTSISFDPHLLEIFWPLSFGASLFIQRYSDRKNSDAIIANIRAHSITILQVVPTLLADICQIIAKQPLNSLPSLRLIICGAEALPVELVKKVFTFIGCKLVNHYGPTEVTVDALAYECSNNMIGNIVPIGKPIDNVKVYICDQQSNLLPRGCIGEIIISSPGLTNGYIDEESLNREKFITKQITATLQPEILYRSGDLGRIDIDGNVHFLGRIDHQIKINGYRVELDSISSCLMNHPGVALACVKQVSITDQHSLLCAFIVLDQLYQACFETKGQFFYQYTLSQKPELRRTVDLIHVQTWPKYFNGSEILSKYWERLYQEYPEFQFCMLDINGKIACVGNGIPLYWDGTLENLPKGWDEGIEIAFQQKSQGIKANTILGLAGIVVEEFKGVGLSKHIVNGFRHLCKMHGLEHFLGPVRPIAMLEHNVYDVHQWAEMVDENNEPLDYWLRVHLRLGAKQLGVAEMSQKISGTLEEWQKWTGVAWQQSGDFLIDGVLQPVSVNHNSNLAVYYDPSIWVAHTRLSELLSPLAHIDNVALKEYLSTLLPAYMLPSQYIFMNKMPLTSNGKIDFNQLVHHYHNDEETIVDPSTERQKFLLTYWKNLLEQDRIGILHDFFLLGGQSLQAIKLLAFIEDHFAVKICLTEFYRCPTVKGIDTAIENKMFIHQGENGCLVT